MLMISQDNLKKYFLYIVIAALVVALIFMKSCNPSYNVTQGKTTIVTKVDTVYKDVVKVEEKKIYVDRVVYKNPGTPQYTPSDNCDTLKSRFEAVLREHLSMKTYKDTVKIDTFGTIVVTDTVWKNELLKRKYEHNYKIPTIIKETTITKPEEPKRKLFYGGNLLTTQTQLQAITPGLLYITKKDQVYQANVGINVNGEFVFGGGMYFKIKLK